MVFLKSSWAQKVQAAHQTYLGKFRQAKGIKSTKVYYKWKQK